MGSALLDATTPDRNFAYSPGHLHAPPDSAPPEPPIALKFQVAQRLAAHRDRRDRLQPNSPAPPQWNEPQQQSPPPSSSAARAARIAAAVAERYARSPSYRAFLAAAADRAIQEAQQAAEAAARNAREVAEAEQQLLDDLDSARIDLAQLDSDALPSGDSHSDPTMRCMADDSLQESVLTDEAVPTLQLCPPPDRSHNAALKAARYRAPSSHDSTIAKLAPALAPSPQYSHDDSTARLTVFLYEDIAGTNSPISPITPVSASQRLIAEALAASRGEICAKQREQNAEEARALDDEIAFRLAPEFEEAVGPPTSIPANLIEFPRQLIAPRKARPREAEGPLRDDSPPSPSSSQLRIFEVDLAQISTIPETADATTPQWTSIWLDAPAHTPESSTAVPTNSARPGRRTWGSTHSAPSADSRTTPHPRPQTATIAKRFFAAAVDGSLVLAGCLAFAACFVLIALHAKSGAGLPLKQLTANAIPFLASHAGVQSSTALFAIAAAIACFYLIYQLLFFSLSEATPGMRCARIALCTFADDNPSRPAMRLRILAVLLSACPLGFGFLWAALDEDRLAWHDLISRMYPRSY